MVDTAQMSGDVGTSIVNLVVNYPIPSGLVLILVGAALLKLRRILFTIVLILPLVAYLQANMSGLLSDVEQRSWLAIILSVAGWGGLTVALIQARLVSTASLLSGVVAIVAGICLVAFSLIDANLIRTHLGALVLWGSSFAAGLAVLGISISLAKRGLTLPSILSQRVPSAKQASPPVVK